MIVSCSRQQLSKDWPEKISRQYFLPRGSGFTLFPINNLEFTFATLEVSAQPISADEKAVWNL
jgi:hypothetical protein